MIGIKWPNKITKKKLYEITGNNRLPITIAKRRWKLLGLILRMPADCPTRNARRYYFEKRSNAKFKKEGKEPQS